MTRGMGEGITSIAEAAADASVTGSVKLPWSAHLQLDQRYPATVATLDPTQSAEPVRLMGKGRS
jgi:hypothetical protein